MKPKTTMTLLALALAAFVAAAPAGADDLGLFEDPIPVLRERATDEIPFLSAPAPRSTEVEPVEEPSAQTQQQPDDDPTADLEAERR